MKTRELFLAAVLSLLIMPAAAGGPAAPLGASYPCNKGDLAGAEARLDKIKAAGFELVSFIPNYTYPALNKLDLTYSPGFEELSRAVEAALRRGLLVVVKPHLEPALYQSGFDTFGSDNHSWRARTGWRGFFDVDPMCVDYREKMLFVQMGAIKEALSRLDSDKTVPKGSIKPIRLEIGTELMNSVVHQPQRWLDLLGAARAELTRLGLKGRVHLSHNFCHHFELPQDFVLRMEPAGRRVLARYIKGLDAFSVSQYMDLTAAMPEAERAKRDPTVSEIAAALRKHDSDLREKVLVKLLKLKPSELPPFHIGEFGVGRGGLRHPNLWEGAATDEENAAIHRQIALGHRGFLEYLRVAQGRTAKSGVLWLTGRYYDIFGWLNAGDAVPGAAASVEAALAANKALAGPPADLDEFWKGTLAALASVPADLKLAGAPEQSDEKVKCFKADYAGFGGMRLYAWYCRPAADGKYPAVLINPWYGRTTVSPPAGAARRGFAALAWQGRGFEVDLPAYPPENSGYALSGIEDRDAYAYRALYANAVRGVDVLASLPEVNAARIGVAGSSQGGGLSLAAAALDPRVAAVSADFPFMCDLYTGVPLSEGTLKSVRELTEREPSKRAAVLSTIPYFDLLNLAPKIKAPVKLQAGLRDTACVPGGIRNVYNAIKSPGRLEEFPDSGHGDDNVLRYEKMMDFIYSALGTEK
ncbi:MAG: hypothetical protein COT18_01200 [Elusimicrobia bacterium CG08_land_8_20_14_0_20_59_10]|nr:MAG: hypothetical protein COT18_01200 [Elusimicrobia bacterium CG08_land_8_20_14_0_20_59_10]